MQSPDLPSKSLVSAASAPKPAAAATGNNNNHGSMGYLTKERLQKQQRHRHNDDDFDGASTSIRTTKTAASHTASRSSSRRSSSTDMNLHASLPALNMTLELMDPQARIRRRNSETGIVDIAAAAKQESAPMDKKEQRSRKSSKDKSKSSKDKTTSAKDKKQSSKDNKRPPKPKSDDSPPPPPPPPSSKNKKNTNKSPLGVRGLYKGKGNWSSVHSSEDEETEVGEGDKVQNEGQKQSLEKTVFYENDIKGEPSTSTTSGQAEKEESKVAAADSSTQQNLGGSFVSLTTSSTASSSPNESERTPHPNMFDHHHHHNQPSTNNIDLSESSLSIGNSGNIVDGDNDVTLPQDGFGAVTKSPVREKKAIHAALATPTKLNVPNLNNNRRRDNIEDLRLSRNDPFVPSNDLFGDFANISGSPSFHKSNIDNVDDVDPDATMKVILPSNITSNVSAPRLWSLPNVSSSFSANGRKKKNKIDDDAQSQEFLLNYKDSQHKKKGTSSSVCGSVEGGHTPVASNKTKVNKPSSGFSMTVSQIFRHDEADDDDDQAEPLKSGDASKETTKAKPSKATKKKSRHPKSMSMSHISKKDGDAQEYQPPDDHSAPHLLGHSNESPETTQNKPAKKTKKKKHPKSMSMSHVSSPEAQQQAADDHSAPILEYSNPSTASKTSSSSGSKKHSKSMSMSHVSSASGQQKPTNGHSAHFEYSNQTAASKSSSSGKKKHPKSMSMSHVNDVTEYEFHPDPRPIQDKNGASKSKGSKKKKPKSMSMSHVDHASETTSDHAASGDSKYATTKKKMTKHPKSMSMSHASHFDDSVVAPRDVASKGGKKASKKDGKNGGDERSKKSPLQCKKKSRKEEKNTSRRDTKPALIDAMPLGITLPSSQDPGGRELIDAMPLPGMKKKPSLHSSDGNLGGVYGAGSLSSSGVQNERHRLTSSLPNLSYDDNGKGTSNFPTIDEETSLYNGRATVSVASQREYGDPAAKAGKSATAGADAMKKARDDFFLVQMERMNARGAAKTKKNKRRKSLPGDPSFEFNVEDESRVFTVSDQSDGDKVRKSQPSSPEAHTAVTRSKHFDIPWFPPPSAVNERPLIVNGGGSQRVRRISLPPTLRDIPFEPITPVFFYDKQRRKSEMAAVSVIEKDDKTAVTADAILLQRNRGGNREHQSAVDAASTKNQRSRSVSPVRNKISESGKTRHGVGKNELHSSAPNLEGGDAVQNHHVEKRRKSKRAKSPMKEGSDGSHGRSLKSSNDHKSKAAKRRSSDPTAPRNDKKTSGKQRSKSPKKKKEADVTDELMQFLSHKSPAKPSGKSKAHKSGTRRRMSLPLAASSDESMTVETAPVKGRTDRRLSAPHTLAHESASVSSPGTKKKKKSKSQVSNR